jgi:hypothetical protein
MYVDHKFTPMCVLNTLHEISAQFSQCLQKYNLLQITILCTYIYICTYIPWHGCLYVAKCENQRNKISLIWFNYLAGFQFQQGHYKYRSGVPKSEKPPMSILPILP